MLLFSFMQRCGLVAAAGQRALLGYAAARIPFGLAAVVVWSATAPCGVALSLMKRSETR